MLELKKIYLNIILTIFYYKNTIIFQIKKDI